MKRIIYTAVALIICASVFGIADYINAKKQGKLVNYTDDEQTSDAIIPEKKNETTVALQKNDEQISNTKKEVKQENKIAKTKVKVDMHYTGTVPDLIVTEKNKDLTELTSKVDMMDVLQAKADDNKSDSVIPETNKRKISLELFSRAPIREKRIKSKH